MREMRDSGVEWIGEIPKDWNCCKQKYRFTLINGRAFKDNEFEEDGTYRILRVGNLFSNPVWYSSSLELEPDKYCEKGDLIYAWSMSYGPYIYYMHGLHHSVPDFGKERRLYIIITFGKLNWFRIWTRCFHIIICRHLQNQ